MFQGEGEGQPDRPRADSEPTAPTTPGGFGQVLDAPVPEGDDGETVAEQALKRKIARINKLCEQGKHTDSRECGDSALPQS